jgi:hypothetical protein
MTWDGSGTYNRVYGATGWVTDKNANTKILASRHDTHDQDIATALNNCLTRDGQGKPSADISWNSHKITSLLDPSSNQDAATKAYVDTGAFATATATATLTGCTTSPTVTAYFQRINRVCVVHIPGITATSNTTGCSITVTYPSGLQPNTSRIIATLVMDNGVEAMGRVDVGGTPNVITLYPSVTGSSFTASGTKGLNQNIAFVYHLAATP